MTIEKKIWPEYFDQIAQGKKQFELRLVDFKIKENDLLVLKEWDPKLKKYTGRKVKTRVTYVLKTEDCPFWPKSETKKYGHQVIQLSHHLKFPRGVEIVTASIIKNKDGKILIARSPKWNNKWSLPGGHIEPGEKIIEAAKRETEEEIGLKINPVGIIRFDELINPKSFHRPVHFIYFECLFEYKGGKIKLEKHELSKYKWVAPKEGLKMDLNEGLRATFENLVKNKNCGFISKKI